MGVFVSQVKKSLEGREVRAGSAARDAGRHRLRARPTGFVAFVEAEEGSFTGGVLPGALGSAF